MVSEVEQQIERANAALERARNRSNAPQGAISRLQIRRAKRFGVMLGAGIVALLAVAMFWTIVIGPLKALAMLMLIIAAGAVFVVAGLLSREADVRSDSIGQGTLPAIADKTDRWLAQQRLTLPAPAQMLADQIGARIANLRPQLERIDERGPEAVELRRLVGEELPDLVTKYTKVPKNLRTEERNGRIPQQELIDGMRLLDAEIDTLARSLGASEMDRLSSQKRYLELRYKGDEGG